MNSNTEKLLTLINGYVSPLPSITLGQLYKIINCVMQTPKNSTAVKAVKILRDLYKQEQIWNMQRGDSFCAFVQQADDALMPNHKSKLDLEKAVEIVRFIDNNRNFL